MALEKGGADGWSRRIQAGLSVNRIFEELSSLVATPWIGAHKIQQMAMEKVTFVGIFMILPVEDGIIKGVDAFIFPCGTRPATPVGIALYGLRNLATVPQTQRSDHRLWPILVANPISIPNVCRLTANH